MQINLTGKQAQTWTHLSTYTTAHAHNWFRLKNKNLDGVDMDSRRFCFCAVTSNLFLKCRNKSLSKSCQRDTQSGFLTYCKCSNWVWNVSAAAAKNRAACLDCKVTKGLFHYRQVIGPHLNLPQLSKVLPLSFQHSCSLQEMVQAEVWWVVTGLCRFFLCLCVCLFSCDKQTHHHHSNISGYLSNCELTVGGAVIHRISASLCLACSARVR